MATVATRNDETDMRFEELIGNTPMVELDRIPRAEGVASDAPSGA